MEWSPAIADLAVRVACHDSRAGDTLLLQRDAMDADRHASLDLYARGLRLLPDALLDQMAG